MLVSPLLDGVRIAVITVSDRSARGERADLTGPELARALGKHGANVQAVTVSDEKEEITAVMRHHVNTGARAVITTGGTGIGPRDVTPEATAALIVTDLPGIPELLRQRDAHATSLVALSRARAGLTERPEAALLLNLPGSQSAVNSALEVLPEVIAHAITQLDGGDH